VTAAAAVVLSLAFASTASADRYIVLYKSQNVPTGAKADVEKGGGTWIRGYDAIGVAIARSSSSAFAGKLRNDSRIDGVSSTAGFASRLREPDSG